MGTNYYWKDDGEKDLEEALHIGKSSAGWCFSLRVNPELGIETLEDWEYRWSRGSIYDEYGAPVEPSDLLRNIVDRYGPGLEDWTPEMLKQNHAVLGPRGLVRHEIDGTHCIKHGKDTYDLMRGEFS